MSTHCQIIVDLFLVKTHPVNFVYRSCWAVMSVFYIALPRAVCRPRTTLTPCPLLNSVLKLRHLCSMSLSDVHFAESQGIRSSTFTVSSPQGVNFSHLALCELGLGRLVVFRVSRVKSRLFLRPGNFIKVPMRHSHGGLSKNFTEQRKSLSHSPF